MHGSYHHFLRRQLSFLGLCFICLSAWTTLAAESKQDGKGKKTGEGYELSESEVEEGYESQSGQDFANPTNQSKLVEQLGATDNSVDKSPGLAGTILSNQLDAKLEEDAAAKQKQYSITHLKERQHEQRKRDGESGQSKILLHRDFSDYEWKLISKVSEQLGADIDWDPEGKVIESIDVATFDVIEDFDPLPTWVNAIHGKTRSNVVRREVLLNEGEEYQQKFTDESERNLRRLAQLSIAVLIPYRGKTNHSVRLVAITKDIWSLRISWDANITNGKLWYFALQPTEWSVGGTGRRAAITTEFLTNSYSIGAGFIEPRLADTRIDIVGTGGAIINCKSGNVEGSYGQVAYGQPQYSTNAKWSWGASVVWDSRYRRRTSGEWICSGAAVPMYDVVENGQVIGSVTDEYYREAIDAQTSVTRSFGWLRKFDFTIGLELDRILSSASQLADVSPEVAAGYRAQRMPTNDSRLSPFIQLHAYENRFQRLINAESLGIQEDWRLGYEAYLKLYGASQSAGSSRDIIGVYSAVSYAVPIYGASIEAVLSGDFQLSSAGYSNTDIGAALHMFTPSWFAGRLIFDSRLLFRPFNYLNPQELLGGNTRLRGYRADAFGGANVYSINLEWRSEPIMFLAINWGLAAFWDIGHAAATIDELKVYQGVGMGLRLMPPQTNRQVLRFDLSLPVPYSTEYGGFTTYFSFEQAFGPSDVRHSQWQKGPLAR